MMKGDFLILDRRRVHYILNRESRVLLHMYEEIQREGGWGNIRAVSGLGRFVFVGRRSVKRKKL